MNPTVPTTPCAIVWSRCYLGARQQGSVAGGRTVLTTEPPLPRIPASFIALVLVLTLRQDLRCCTTPTTRVPPPRPTLEGKNAFPKFAGMVW